MYSEKVVSTSKKRTILEKDQRFFATILSQKILRGFDM